MNKDIIVTKGKVQIVNPINLLIEYDKDNVRIIFGGNKNNEIVFGNNTKLLVDGDLYIASKGELGLFTKDSNLCMDSIGGNIYLNSRMSKIHKDDTEAIEYRKKLEEKEKCKCGSLLDEIDKLRERLKILEDGLQTKPI